MRFYRLVHPNYATDTVHSRKNPITWFYEYGIPGTVCSVCGAWAGNRRLFVPVEDSKLEKLLKRQSFPIPLEEWKKLFSNPSGSFNLPSGIYLRPGDKLGKPTGKITNNEVPDFVFPWEGGCLVTEKTMKVIIESKLTGCEFSRMELVDKRSKKGRGKPLPMVYVLIVTGRIKPPSKVDRCPVCGRFKANYSVELNAGNWDGNDFLLDENYPELVFVTERVCSVFEGKGLINFECNPI